MGTGTCISSCSLHTGMAYEGSEQVSTVESCQYGIFERASAHISKQEPLCLGRRELGWRVASSGQRRELGSR